MHQCFETTPKAACQIAHQKRRAKNFSFYFSKNLAPPPHEKKRYLWEGKVGAKESRKRKIGEADLHDAGAGLCDACAKCSEKNCFGESRGLLPSKQK